MIIEYSRPETVEKALSLLERQNPKSIPLGGGTSLAQYRGEDSLAVIDLQALGMREIFEKNGSLEIGANVTLQQLHDHPRTPSAYKVALEMEGNFNLRQAATVGGTIASGGGGSAFNALLQAVGAQIIWQPGEEIITYPILIQKYVKKVQGFITQVQIPLHVRTSIEKVSRTPLSPSILCVCGAFLPGKFIRIVIPDTASKLAEVLFEDNPDSGKPDFQQLVTQWIRKHQIDDAYIASVLPVMIDRVMTTLRKEG